MVDYLGKLKVGLIVDSHKVKKYIKELEIFSVNKEKKKYIYSSKKINNFTLLKLINYLKDLSFQKKDEIENKEIKEDIKTEIKNDENINNNNKNNIHKEPLTESVDNKNNKNDLYHKNITNNKDSTDIKKSVDKLDSHKNPPVNNNTNSITDYNIQNKFCQYKSNFVPKTVSSLNKNWAQPSTQLRFKNIDNNIDDANYFNNNELQENNISIKAPFKEPENKPKIKNNNIKNNVFETEKIKVSLIDNDITKNIGIVQLLEEVGNNKLKIKKNLLKCVNSFIACLGPPGSGKSTFCSNYYKSLFNVKYDYFESSDEDLTFTKGIWIISDQERRKIPIMIKKIY